LLLRRRHVHRPDREIRIRQHDSTTATTTTTTTTPTASALCQCFRPRGEVDDRANADHTKAANDVHRLLRHAERIATCATSLGPSSLVQGNRHGLILFYAFTAQFTDIRADRFLA
jgi:hypothetical protein